MEPRDAKARFLFHSILDKIQTYFFGRQSLRPPFLFLVFHPPSKQQFASFIGLDAFTMTCSGFNSHHSMYNSDGMQSNYGKKRLMESCSLKRDRMSREDDEKDEHDRQGMLATSRPGNDTEQRLKRFRTDLNLQCKDKKVRKTDHFFQK